MVRLPRNWRVKFMLGISLAALLGVGMTYFLRPYLPQTSLHATNDVSAIAFTRDGRMMATGNDVDVQGHNAMGYWAYGAGEVQVRCGPDWRVVRAVPFLHSAVVQGDAEKNGGPIGWLRFSPDGGRLMVGNQDSSTFGVLDVATGRWLFSRQDNFDSAHHLFMPIVFHGMVRRFFTSTVPLASHCPNKQRERNGARLFIPLTLSLVEHQTAKSFGAPLKY